MPPTKFEVVTTTTGAVSIRDRVTGETMHNPVGPWIEANALYVDQSRLVERLGRDLDRDLVVFDVGLGAAANALAVLHAARGVPRRRELRLVSFERDLDLLEFALAHADRFTHFEGFQPAVRALLDDGRWEAPGLTWELRRGDFGRTIEDEPRQAHLIFHDPYSPTKNVDMWTVATFTKLRRACAPEGALLLTYSRATPVRVALLMAGFFVGAGRASGLKDETTQAATSASALDRPLDGAWLERWGRSDAQTPPGAPAEIAARVRETISSHAQFARGPAAP